MWYGTRQNMLIRRVERSRREAKHILREMNECEVPDESMKDIILIRQFILARVNYITRFALRLSFEEIEGLPPEPVNPFLWCLCWFLTTGSLCFFIYWIFAWGIRNSGEGMNKWGQDFGVACIQDIFICEVLKILFMVVWALATARPQLHQIRRVITEKAIALAQDEVEPDVDIHVVQHFCPACRVARMRDYEKLATAAILRRLTDADLERCNTHRYFIISTIIFIVLLSIALFVILGEKILDNIVEVVVLLIWSGFVAGNSYLFVASPFAVVLIYSLVTSGIIYQFTIFRPTVITYRRNVDKSFSRRSSERSRGDTKHQLHAPDYQLKPWQREFLRSWHFFELKVRLFFGQFNFLLSPFEQHTLRADRRIIIEVTWTRMNKTHMMQVSNNELFCLYVLYANVTNCILCYVVLLLFRCSGYH